MKKLLLMVLILAGCGTGPSPSPTPVVPPVPTPKYAHQRGYNKVPGQKGLIPGKGFMLADRVGELPLKFNWVSAGFDIPVHDQGNCGSCWAFSSTENLEWQAVIFLNKKLVLSEQQLVGNLFSGCGGGDFAGSYEVANGMYLASDCPYQADNSNCHSGLTVAIKPVDQMNIGDGNNSPTIVQIKSAILEYGPLSVDVAAGGDWDSVGPNDVIDGNNGGINHMVIIYGWDDSIDGGSWMMRNSWSSNWGNGGSAPVKYGADSIAQDVATVLVNTPASYRHPIPTK